MGIGVKNQKTEENVTMKCSKKILSVITILLVVSVGIVLPVQADSISVDYTATDGDIYATINYRAPNF